MPWKCGPAAGSSCWWSSSSWCSPSQCCPQLVHRVRPPWTPAFGCGAVEIERGERTPHTEVAVEEDVRVAQPAHDHVLGGPRTDAAHADELVDERRAVGARVEIELAGDHELPDPPQRGGASGGHG